MTEMDAGEEYCLRWNNHHPNFISVFKSLLDYEELVDVTISVEGKQIKAHKVILSACSPFFKLLFKETPCKHPLILMNGIKFVDLKKIIEFIYCGEINVPDDQLADILEVAETLQVKGLFDPKKKIDQESENLSKRKRRKNQTGSKTSEDTDEHTFEHSISDPELNRTIHPIDFLDTSQEYTQFESNCGVQPQMNSQNYSESEIIEDGSARNIDMNVYGHSIGVTGRSSKEWNQELTGNVRRRYNKDKNNANFLLAMEAVRSGSLGFCKAAKLYGVNNRTLWLEYKKRGYKSNRPPVARSAKTLVSQPS